MNSNDPIRVIEASIDLSDTWDHCTYREMAGEGSFVDRAATQDAYTAEVRRLLEEHYPGVEIELYPSEHVPGHDAVVAVNYEADSAAAAEVADQLAKAYQRMDKLTVLRWYRIETVETYQELSATDLREEAAQAVADGHTIELGRVVCQDEAEAIEVLYIVEDQRAGLAWGADASWTDAESLEEAVQRFLGDGMTE